MRKLYHNILVFFIPLFAGAIVLFLLPVDKKFSYQFVKGECENKASWIYNRMYENQKPIDVAFSGASHIACGIMDEIIENELNKISHEKKHITNLGYCRGGRDIQYVMLKDLFERKSPELLFISVTEDEPKKSHPVFPYLAVSRDLFGSYVFFNQRYLSSIWKGLSMRFEFLKFKIFKNSYVSFPNQSDYGYIPGPFQADSASLIRNINAWKYRLSHQNPTLIRKIETHYSKYYLAKIVQLAKENRCAVKFIYLPESGSQLKSPLLSEYYQSLAETIYLPDSIINNTMNWKDPTHFNDRGAKLTSDYIASQIMNMLY